VILVVETNEYTICPETLARSLKIMAPVQVYRFMLYYFKFY